jgi:hypothetical protein
MNKQQNFLTFKPDYELERSKIENFLRTFVDKSIIPDRLHDQRKYMIQLVFIIFNSISKQLQIEN